MIDTANSTATTTSYFIFSNEKGLRIMLRVVAAIYSGRSYYGSDRYSTANTPNVVQCTVTPLNLTLIGLMINFGCCLLYNSLHHQYCT